MSNTINTNDVVVPIAPTGNVGGWQVRDTLYFILIAALVLVLAGLTYLAIRDKKVYENKIEEQRKEIFDAQKKIARLNNEKQELEGQFNDLSQKFSKLSESQKKFQEQVVKQEIDLDNELSENEKDNSAGVSGTNNIFRHSAQQQTSVPFSGSSSPLTTASNNGKAAEQQTGQSTGRPTATSASSNSPSKRDARQNRNDINASTIPNGQINSGKHASNDNNNLERASVNSAVSFDKQFTNKISQDEVNTALSSNSLLQVVEALYRVRLDSDKNSELANAMKKARNFTGTGGKNYNYKEDLEEKFKKINRAEYKKYQSQKDNKTNWLGNYLESLKEEASKQQAEQQKAAETKPTASNNTNLNQQSSPKLAQTVKTEQLKRQSNGTSNSGSSVNDERDSYHDDQNSFGSEDRNSQKNNELDSQEQINVASPVATATTTNTNNGVASTSVISNPTDQNDPEKEGVNSVSVPVAPVPQSTQQNVGGTSVSTNNTSEILKSNVVSDTFEQKVQVTSVIQDSSTGSSLVVSASSSATVSVAQSSNNAVTAKPPFISQASSNNNTLSNGNGRAKHSAVSTAQTINTNNAKGKKDANESSNQVSVVRTPTPLTTLNNKSKVLSSSNADSNGAKVIEKQIQSTQQQQNYTLHKNSMLSSESGSQTKNEVTTAHNASTASAEQTPVNRHSQQIKLGSTTSLNSNKKAKPDVTKPFSAEQIKQADEELLRERKENIDERLGKLKEWREENPRIDVKSSKHYNKNAYDKYKKEKTDLEKERDEINKVLSKDRNAVGNVLHNFRKKVNQPEVKN